MKRLQPIPALLLMVLVLPAMDPGPFGTLRYHESFDQVESLAATRLIPLGGAGRLSLVPSSRGRRLEMRGDVGFALPLDCGSRGALSMSLEHAGGGTFLLGDDRDPQHGFSKILSVDPNGRLSLTGSRVSLSLAPSRSYRIRVLWRWLDGERLLLEGLEITDDTKSVTLESGAVVAALKGAPVPFLRRGGGSTFVDDLTVHTR